MKPILLSPPHMNGTEMSYIQDAFEKNWIAPLGENVDKFEESLKSYLECENEVCSLSSGTAAIHLALIRLGVTEGDEVICQSFTFSASANPIKYLNAKPVFIGSEKNSWNLDPIALRDCLEEKVKQGKKPKAVIVVHLYGSSSMMNEIVSICHEYDVALIEDSAEALGSSYHGKRLGTFGKYGVLSFNGNKIITTSGGGALVVENEKEKKEIIYLATQARMDKMYYEHSDVGYNYRLSNICAGIGRGQMNTLQEYVDKRRDIFENYKTYLSKYDFIKFQPEIENSISNRWLTALVMEGLGQEKVFGLIKFLQSQKIEARPLWKPMHLQPIFKDCQYYGDSFCEELFENGLCLPSGSAMTEDEQKIVVDKIIEYLSENL